MEEQNVVSKKKVRVKFTCRGVIYEHDCKAFLNQHNKMLTGEPLKQLKLNIFTALIRAGYVSREDIKKNDKDVFNMISNVEVSVLV